MTKKFALFVSLFILVCMPSDARAATIRISAPKVQLELAPGETYSGEMTAENPTEEEVKVKIYLQDWVYSPGGRGEKNFTPVGSTPLSAGKWIVFTPTEDTIKPFGRTTVRYTVTVPQEAKGAHYAVLFFETVLGTAKDEEGVNVLVAGRVGSLFYIETKGLTERSGEIKSVDLKPSEGNKPTEIITTFRNTGDVDISLGGNYLILDKEGKVYGRGDLNKIYTFPKETETGKSEWVGRLAKGSYQVVLTYDLGKGKNIVEEKTLTVS